MGKTVKGGRYLVNGQLVNAEGEPLKGGKAKAEPEKPKATELKFADAAAEKAAKDAGLMAADFDGIEASSDAGYTADDVAAIVELKKGA